MALPHARATFGRLLREYRHETGVTQEGLATRSGVSLRTIQDLESEAVRPRRSTAQHLADALAISKMQREALIGAAAPAPRRRPPTFADEPVHDRARTVPASVTPAAAPNLPHIHEHFLTPVRTNVPWPVNRLVGRESDILAVRKLISVDRHRLVTLTGVGGAGKTRLAVEFGAEMLEDFEDGVWFVDLTSSSRPDQLPRVIAGALGVLEVQDVPIQDSVVEFLRRKRLLLLLDNCEHLIESCAEVAERLLSACPDLHILATSREPLRAPGEQRWRVQPLAVPALDGPTGFDAVNRSAAALLFVDRGRSIDPEFELTAANARPIAQICARLDGIPLAIELAASRIGILSPEQIVARLDDGFRMLAGSSRSAPSRQRTMEAALAWSYELLSEHEQSTFRILSIFAGGFDLEACERVCASQSSDVDGSQLPADVLEELSSLVDKSLVVAEPTDRGRRYRLLEPVRQYGKLLLDGRGECDRAREAHATYFVALAEQVAPRLRGSDQLEWLDRLDVERANLLAALDWTVEQAQDQAAIRLAIALTPYWEARGLLSEGRNWLDRVLENSAAFEGASVLRLRALIGAGLLAQWQADLERAEVLLQEALVAARALADRRSEAEILAWLSSAYWQRPAVEQGLELGETSLRIAHELGDAWLIAFANLNVGVGSRFAGATARAVTVLDECVRRFRELGDVRYVAIGTAMFGWATMESGDHDRAAIILREALRTLLVVGDQRFIRSSLRALARVSDLQGRSSNAAMLMSAGEALRTALGMRHTQRERDHTQQLLGVLREKLGQPGFDQAVADGEALTLDQVLAVSDAEV